MPKFELTLLPDTKLRKYILQQILCRDLTSDLTQMMQRLPDVQGKQVAGGAFVHALQHAVEGFVGLTRLS